MKRTEIDGTVTDNFAVADYIAKGASMPSPNWVSKDELGSTRMLSLVIVFLVIAAVLLPQIIRALAAQ